MRSRIRSAMLIAVIALITLFTFVAPRLAAAADADRPCKVDDSVIESNRSILIRCAQTNPNLPATAELHAVDATTDGDPNVKTKKIADLDVSTVMTKDGVAPQWRRFTIQASSTVVLTAPTRYFLHIPASLPPAPANLVDKWKPFWFAVPTTGLEVTVTDAAASIQSGERLRLRAKIALKRPSGASLCITIDDDCKPRAAVFTVAAPASVPPSSPGLPVSPVPPVVDPEEVGNADIVLASPRLRPGKVKLQVEGLTDVLEQPVTIDEKSRTEILGRKLSGKTKDEVGTYIKFGHEAADVKKPAWTLDAKAQIELARRVRHWRIIPNASADIGLGSAKTTNAITLGTSFVRYDLFSSDFESPRETEDRGKKREQRVLQGMRFAVTPTLETDRDFDKRNVIADVDAELFFRGLYNPIATQNRRRRREKRKKVPGAEMEDVVRSRFGFVVSIKGGLEAGGALYDQRETFDVGEGAEMTSTTVEAPAYGIARVRVKAGVLLEFFKYMTLDIQGTGRWLGTTERSLLADGDAFVRQDFDGAHAYGQATVSIALTDTVSLDSAYKVGKQPPQFQRVSTVQTGLAFRF